MIRLNLFMIWFLHFLSLLSVICRYYRQNSSSQIIVVLVYTVSTLLFVYQYTEEYEHAIRMPDGVKTPYYGTKYIYGFCGVLRPYP